MELVTTKRGPKNVQMVIGIIDAYFEVSNEMGDKY